MNIDYLIQLLTNRYNGLLLAKDQAFQSGELERIIAVDAEILDVQNTLSKLKLISTIEQTASLTPFSEAQVVRNGIEYSFNPTVLNDATSCLLLYNIVPYATDPNHELKIQTILENMGVMYSSSDIDAYLQSTAPLSPLTGDMIFQACEKYLVDTRLAMAIMQQDSLFGTIGIGARTFNPGNVGNTGSSEHTFTSWEEGVEAVAMWLDNHRIIAEDIKAEIIPTVIETTSPANETPPPVVETPPAETPVSETPPAETTVLETTSPANETPPPVVETPPAETLIPEPTVLETTTKIVPPIITSVDTGNSN